MNELNKKLAEWAGLKEFCTPESDMYHRGIWEDSLGMRFDTPNFNESLDACFKWLVSKAILVIIDNPIWHLANEPEEQKIDEATELLFKEWLRQMAYPYKHKAALALCKAIEKLIDSEVK